MLTVRCVIPSQSGAESLLLLADHFAWIGAAKTLEFEVLADGVIEQSHAPKPYLSGPPRFLGIAIEARNAPRACQGAGSGPAPLRTLGGLIVRQAPVASRSDYTWPYRAFAMRGAIAQLGERLDRTQEVGVRVPLAPYIKSLQIAGSNDCAGWLEGRGSAHGPIHWPNHGGAAVIWRLGTGVMAGVRPLAHAALGPGSGRAIDLDAARRACQELSPATRAVSGGRA